MGAARSPNMNVLKPFFFLLVIACSSPKLFHGSDDGGAMDDSSGNPQQELGGDGPSGDGGCVNLLCDVPACPTSVSGTVFDPAGKLPLYDIAVYIPNAPLAPIPDGVDINKCDSCSAPLSGNPISVTLTDSHGHFRLDKVPVTSAPVPLVIQAGKFRRENYLLPPLTACQDNPIVDPMHNVRLPRNQKEGHLPLIAIATGECDNLGCILGHYGFGIDDSEFTAASGKGRMHLYDGSGGFSSGAGTVPGSTDAFALWGSKDIFKYDILVNNCDCGYTRRDTKGPAYDNMKTYLDHGGRLFASHWHFNWFWDGPPEWKSAVNWAYSNGSGVGYGYQAPQNTCFIDTGFPKGSFPKGTALDDWTQFIYKNNYATTGTFPPAGTDPVSWPVNPLANESHAGITRWIYADGPNMPMQSAQTGYATKFLSMNTPFSTNNMTKQCGRAVFADTHVSQYTDPVTPYPTGCDKLPNDASSGTQITALEFLFFDLSSCVQDETQPPVIPPT